MASISVPAAIIAGSTLTDALAAVTVTEAITAVGAVVSAVGMITGNKDLSYAGMALGVVGGIGSLASSAGLLGSPDDPTMGSLFGPSAASSTAPSDLTGATGALSDVQSASGTTLAGAPVTSGADVANPDIIDSVTGGSPLDVAQSTGVTNPLDVTAEASGTPDVAPAAETSPDLTGATEAPATASGSMGAQTTTAIPPQQVGIPQGTGTAPAIPGSTAPSAPSVTDLAAAPSAPGVTSDTKALIASLQNNTFKQSVISGAVQAGGSLLSGLTNPVTPAQVSALNAQAAENQAATQLSLTQQANMAQPKPVATLGPGLINNPSTAAA